MVPVWEDADDLGAALGWIRRGQTTCLSKNLRQPCGMRQAERVPRRLRTWTGPTRRRRKTGSLRHHYGSSGASRRPCAAFGECWAPFWRWQAGTNSGGHPSWWQPNGRSAELLDAVRRLGGDQHH